MDQTMPFISSMIDKVSLKDAASPGDLFKTIASDQEVWEKQQIPDLRILQPGRAFFVKRLPAYDRVLENPSQDAMMHNVYILYGNAFIQLGLNAKRSEFEKYDKDFMGILDTFEQVPLSEKLRTAP